MSAERVETTRARLGRALVDHAVGGGIAILYLAILMNTSVEIGMSRDEGFYVTAADSYGSWFELFFEDASAAMERGEIDRRWEYNHEHPGLMKSLFALSRLADREWDLFVYDSTAYRFPGMVTGALLLWLVYLWGRRLWGPVAGGMAALFLGLVPRYFYHSHLDAFDIPIAYFVTLSAYAYWRSLTARWWIPLAGLFYGLALATKHNAWVLPGIYLVHFVWAVVASRKDGEAISARPWWLLSIVLLGPMVLVATWPWLWADVGTALERYGWYAGFHLNHVYYDMAYFGRNYFHPPFPVSYPFVMTLMTVSLTMLALGIGGILHRVRAWVPDAVLRRVFGPLERFGVVLPADLPRADRSRSDVLLFGMLAAPYLMIALPSSPIFGGTKHWITAYPFLALYAGYAAARLLSHARSCRLALWLEARLRPLALVPGTLAALLLLAPSAIETAHSHPFGLSHYVSALGGVPGAATLGMNRQFWGFTTGSVVDFLNESMPDGGSVYVCDTVFQAWQILQADGRLARNIRPSGDLINADYVLVHHEHHFAEVDHQAWIAHHGDVQPVHVLRYDGVPIVTIYAHPRRR